QHDDGDGIDGLERAADVQTVKFGQHQIQHQQIGRVFADQLEGALAVMRDAHVESSVFEVELDQLDRLAIVVDDQDLCHPSTDLRPRRVVRGAHDAHVELAKGTFGGAHHGHQHVDLLIEIRLDGV